MKDAYYFSHDSNARNDEKMLLIREKYGWEGYGLFFGIIEILRESTDYVIKAPLMGGLSLALNYPKDELLDFINKCVDIGLLCRNDEYVWSESLLERMKIKDAMSLKFSNAGKRGAKIRWGNDSTPISPTNSKGKESKGKEKKVNIEIPLFWDYFLLKTQKKFSLTKDKKELIRKRLAEHSLDTLKKAVDNFVADDWEGRADHLDLIYCIGKQKGKPDNLEKWINKLSKDEKEYIPGTKILKSYLDKK